MHVVLYSLFTYYITESCLGLLLENSLDNTTIHPGEKISYGTRISSLELKGKEDRHTKV